MGDKVTYTKNVEWSNDHQGKEQGVVVKDGKGCGLVLGDLGDKNKLQILFYCCTMD